MRLKILLNILNVPSLGPITPLPADRFPNKIAPNVTNNMIRNTPSLFVCFISVVLLASFINKSDATDYG